MNTQILKYLGAFALGTAVGSLATILLIKEKYVEYAQEETNEEDLSEIIKNREGSILVETRNGEVTKIQTEKNVGLEVPNKKAELTGQDLINRLDEQVNTMKRRTSEPLNEYEKAKINYNLVGSSATKSEEVEEIDFRDESIDEETPYMITEESFSEEFLNHEKISITYFVSDDTLMDEDEQIMNAEESIGDDNFRKIGSELTHYTVVYVRNEKLRIDYEITILHEHYSEVILGYTLS